MNEFVKEVLYIFKLHLIGHVKKLQKQLYI